DQTLFFYGLRVVEHTRLTFVERYGYHPHPRLSFDKVSNGIGAGVAGHALDFEHGSFHFELRFANGRPCFRRDRSRTKANPWRYLPGQARCTARGDKKLGV